ncbi:MAG: DNA polymerase III subunit gamma/tau [Vallitaleaceae bacterium]|nr:DNA polymerase III subunit gamma/tau [Vallitaleaceae bacterium]
MSYTALYRKWRPDSFDHVVGQDHIVKTLTNQLIAGRLSHAYLFCGTRGTGKTSTAKIFAKAVNCLTPVNGSPCNHCVICENIQNNQSMNIIEIDAASNNGVDNIREIREEVRYTPTEGKYKVYIIDEVHMLSTGAFNALLKTLEEPPSHAIFILATTEAHKIPATILSRCQRYDFKRISVQVVTDTLIKYLKEEGVQVEESAVRYVAKVADGSMRDALSILDQCIAFYLGETITHQMVLNVLGAVDTTVFTDTVHALLKKDVKACMDIVENISVLGRDLQQFLFDLIHHLRNLLLLRSIDDVEGIVEMSEENMVILKEQSKLLSEGEIIYYIKTFAELESKLKMATQKRVLIEVEFMKLCQPTVNSSFEGLMERLRHLEKRVDDGIQISQAPPVEKIKEEPKVIKKTILPEAIPKDIKAAMQRFSELIDKTTGMEKAILTRTTPAYLEDEFLYLICDDDIQKNRLLLPENLEKINTILTNMHQREFKLKILSIKEYDVLALNNKDTITGAIEAKSVFESIKSQINFDIQVI